MKFLHKPSKAVERFPFFDNEMDRMFEGFFRPTSKFWGDQKGMPTVDIKDKKNHYELTADLPGFDKDEINVDFSNGLLQIKAEHSEEKKEEQGGEIVLNERHYGSYIRSFNFGDAIDSSDVTATFKNGVLHLNLPKSASAEENKKTIAIK